MCVCMHACVLCVCVCILSLSISRGMMRKAHLQLATLNQEIIAGYEIRRNNHLELMDHLRIVNQTIKRAANLRGE